MSREHPVSEAWARYYRAHPEVLSTWGEANGREPKCSCEKCNPGMGQCSGGGERWERRQDGAAACPGCGAAWWRFVARAPGRARVGGGFLGHVPSHLVHAAPTTPPAATRPLPAGGRNVIRDLSDWSEP